jgi:16S rRNA (guanine(1405)-N(7))-methyltransferase
MDQAEFEDIIEHTRKSRKYRELNLPEETLQDMLTAEAASGGSKAEVIQRFRKKLHNVIAPYLENIDYAQETKQMKAFFQANQTNEQVKAWALSVMQKHASTRERLPNIAAFCQVLRAYIGTPHRILDLACALDPLLLPWLALPSETEFFAYDIHQPRIEFLNTFFALLYPSAHAIQQDILINPPTQSAECAFFFKEAHRFEKRAPGCNRAFFQALPVNLIAVSLPTEDLRGHHSLVSYHTQLIYTAIAGLPWELEQTQVGNELLFFIHKP